MAQVGILCLQVHLPLHKSCNADAQGTSGDCDDFNDDAADIIPHSMQCAGPPQLFAPKYLGPDSVEWPCGLAQLVKL